MISKIFGSPMRLAAVSVLLVALFCIAVLALSGCAGGNLKLPDLGDMKVNDLVQTGGEAKQYKTEVDVSIKSDLDNIPEVSVSSGSGETKSYSVIETTPAAPTPTPYIGPGEPTKPPDKTPEIPTQKPTMGPVKPRPTPPQPTPPGPKPTPEPTPEKSMKVCVSKIPIMTLENRDELNKQLLFCASVGDQRIGVYHRYVEPKNGNPWFPAWRIEAWDGDHQVMEWYIFDAHKLIGESAQFLIDYSGAIEVTCLTTGDSQHLDWKFPAGKVPQLGEDEACETIGWPSKAEARLCK